MKRFIAAAALFLMSLPFSAFGGKMSAGDFGLIGGANFCSANIAGVNAESMTQWHAGLAYKFNLPLGFHIQPALLYNVKGSDFNLPDTDFSVGYLELMASVQWGIDLILFRPFLDVSPYVGYALNNELTASTASAARLSADFVNRWEGINRLEYGLGLGGGLEIWKVQLVCRYNWNFGQLFDASGKTADADELIGNVERSVFDGKNFGGVTLSVALLF